MKAIKEYWEKAIPMSFRPEGWSYKQRRKFRYDLQDYMHEVFRFQDFKDKYVLEIGCGSGIDAIEFAKNGAIVAATDITKSAMDMTTRTREEALITNASLAVVPAEGHDLPFRSNLFDCVYSYGVLHHISNVEEVLVEAHRVLKVGGKIMAMLYHKDSLLYAYSIVHLHKDSDLAEAELVKQYSERIEGCPYTRAYTKEEARELFESWFREVEVSVHYNVLDLPGERKVKFSVDDKWELGWHLVVKGKK